ncbi:hypothetical protein ACFWZU_12225 [Frateuria sp. GZRR33]|uniref:hypothetical protein n=1 Tax=Frateuria sp. GZRR33 TaxID=3351535 RepID=UPI003EDB7FF7
MAVDKEIAPSVVIAAQWLRATSMEGFDDSHGRGKPAIEQPRAGAGHPGGRHGYLCVHRHRHPREPQTSAAQCAQPATAQVAFRAPSPSRDETVG